MKVGSRVKVVADFEKLGKIYGFQYPKIGDVLTVSEIVEHPDVIDCQKLGIVLLSFKEIPHLPGLSNKDINGKDNFVEFVKLSQNIALSGFVKLTDKMGYFKTRNSSEEGITPEEQKRWLDKMIRQSDKVGNTHMNNPDNPQPPKDEAKEAAKEQLLSMEHLPPILSPHIEDYREKKRIFNLLPGKKTNGNILEEIKETNEPQPTKDEARETTLEIRDATLKHILSMEKPMISKPIYLAEHQKKSEAEPPEMTPKEFYHERVTKPPLGLMPKEIHDERVISERFMEVCRAISRYYNTGESINVEWIEEYNELIKSPTIAKYLLECKKVRLNSYDRK